MALNMRQKSNVLFAQLVGLGGLLVTISLAAFYKIYTFVFSSVGEIFVRQANTVCGCQILPATSTNYTILGIVIFLGLAILAAFVLAGLKIVTAIMKTNRFLRIQKTNLVKTSEKLNQVAGYLGIQDTVVEISSSRPLIFCHGLKKSKIYISSAVVHTLSCAQLQAVLLHETHHLLEREPAKLLFIKFLSAFAVIPGIKNLIKKYLSLAEIAADEMATNNFTEKNHLASAMAKILEMEEKNIIQKELALSYFSQITEDRVLMLSNSSYRPAFAQEVIRIISSLVGVVIIFLLLNANVSNESAQARTVNQNANCNNKIYYQEKIRCSQVDKSYLQS